MQFSSGTSCISTWYIDVSRPRFSMPSPVEALPCGSRSMINVRWPSSARQAPTLMVVVVLPTPPFWLATAMIRGSGRCADARSADRSTAPAPPRQRGGSTTARCSGSVGGAGSPAGADGNGGLPSASLGAVAASSGKLIRRFLQAQAEPSVDRADSLARRADIGQAPRDVPRGTSTDPTTCYGLALDASGFTWNMAAEHGDSGDPVAATRTTPARRQQLGGPAVATGHRRLADDDQDAAGPHPTAAPPPT